MSYLFSFIGGGHGGGRGGGGGALYATLVSSLASFCLVKQNALLHFPLCKHEQEKANLQSNHIQYFKTEKQNHFHIFH